MDVDKFLLEIFILMAMGKLFTPNRRYPAVKHEIIVDISDMLI
jgi:hypothetical protein